MLWGSGLHPEPWLVIGWEDSEDDGGGSRGISFVPSLHSSLSLVCPEELWREPRSLQ